MDDDVQYLGTKFAPVVPLDDPSLTGITLHVDKCGDKPAHTLSFHRARSGYVNIGRKSASDDRSMRRENDDHNAVFTCQVVSARHAKLVFSDAGQVYIVDLHSRHGTHLLRNGETTPRMLQPEVDTLLADGDVLTFGKVVGAGSYHVSPVTVRVELLSGSTSSEPRNVRALTPFDPPSPVVSRPRKLSSGRYGLISQVASCAESSDSPHSSSSISVSSDGVSSPSELESDLDDEHECLPDVLRDPQGTTSVKIPAFRSFIRDIYHNTVPHSPVTTDLPDDPLEAAPVSPTCADIVRQSSPSIIIIEASPKSRSHSPIEATSPSSSLLSEAPQPDPAVVGAWPTSRPESPRHSSLEVETGQSEVHPVSELDQAEPLLAQPPTCQNRISPVSNDALIELMHRLPPPPPFFPVGGPFSNSITSDFGLPSVPPPPPPPPPPACRIPPYHIPPFHPLQKVVTECVNSELRGSFKGIDDRITGVQETVTDLKSRQIVTEDDVVELRGRIKALEPDSQRLLCRIIGAERHIATLSTMPGQMTGLQNQVATLRGRLDAPEPKPVASSLDDLKACADALTSLMLEMRSLREDTEKRIEAKMEAIQNARAEALNEFKEVGAEYLRSTKRKRADEIEEEEAAEVPLVVDKIQGSEATVPHVPIPQVPASIPDVSIAPTKELSATEVSAHDSRPRKRARTAMYTIAHTAAAMAIGAAATWSALAFS